MLYINVINVLIPILIQCVIFISVNQYLWFQLLSIKYSILIIMKAIMYETICNNDMS